MKEVRCSSCSIVCSLLALYIQCVLIHLCFEKRQHGADSCRCDLRYPICCSCGRWSLMCVLRAAHEHNGGNCCRSRKTFEFMFTRSAWWPAAMNLLVSASSFSTRLCSVPLTWESPSPLLTLCDWADTLQHSIWYLVCVTFRHISPLVMTIFHCAVRDV